MKTTKHSDATSVAAEAKTAAVATLTGGNMVTGATMPGAGGYFGPKLPTPTASAKFGIHFSRSLSQAAVPAVAKTDWKTFSAGKIRGDLPVGTTPLMLAAGFGHLGVVRQLLRAGADMHAVDEHRHNALFWALRWDQTDSARELVMWGSKLTADALCGPVRNGNAELVRLLIRKGANPNARFYNFDDDTLWPDGETLLGYAVTVAGILDYPMEIIEFLVNAGADVNEATEWFAPSGSRAPTKPERTSVVPLRIAASRGMENVMSLLWNSGAHVTLEQAMAGSSLECAVLSNSPGVVRLLIRAGVNVNAPGENTGMSPLALARQKQFCDIVTILEAAHAR